MSVFTLPQMPAAQQPAEDMKELAARVRALFSIRTNETSRMPLGGTMFDVVVTAGGYLGRVAVVHMDEIQLGTCGPVIEDPDGEWLYWLVPPGTASSWDHHPYGVCVGSPHTLSMPVLGQSGPPGPYWLRPCASDRLVPPGPLRALLYRMRLEPAPHEGLQAHLGRREALV
ncbi:hypothetical protein ACFCZR_24615 [Streptomyces rubiginosohelvolus]|uniref:hypothetical protein n=1 Tax=Streptomyces rubiginosohelvolus TaxID=67362 RepID=UPI0035E1C9A6